MLFNSLPFLIFFPVVAVLYFVIPSKWRWVWLLFASYYFYMSWNAAYGLLLFGTTFITWVSGYVSDKLGESKKLPVLIATIVINLGLLAYFKYLGFAIGTLNAVLARIGVSLSIPEFDVLLPVGISFFTFQSLGYAIDVYRGTVKAEKNFFRYALFISFFPQLVAGPIERTGSLLMQMKKPTAFKYENLQRGFLMMLYGYLLKVVMADNIAIAVDRVFNSPGEFSGAYFAVATVLFAFQIYGDFGGYSMIARGAAKIMGFELMDNFESPYMSLSVSEFWRRWHASLGKWFRDYLYIPLGGSRKGTVRKYINVMIVFLLSGLWHGAAWHFVVWGGLNGLFQVAEGVMAPMADRLVKALKVRTDTDSHSVLKCMATFICVDFAWLFFRAHSLREAFAFIRSFFTERNLWIIFTEDIFRIGLDRYQLSIVIYAILTVMFLDYRKRKGFDTCGWVLSQQYWFRAAVYTLAIVAILLFGAWGGGYSAAGFIYFQF